MRISGWSSDVCSSDLQGRFFLSNEPVIHRSLRSGATLAARGVSQRLPSLADENETARSVWLADHDRPSQAIFAGQHFDERTVVGDANGAMVFVVALRDRKSTRLNSSH